MDTKKAALEIIKRVDAGASFYPVAVALCNKHRLSYPAVVAEFHRAKGNLNEPFLAEVYNANGARVG